MALRNQLYPVKLDKMANLCYNGNMGRLYCALASGFVRKIPRLRVYFARNHINRLVIFLKIL